MLSNIRRISFLWVLCAFPLIPQSLRIATVNVWSGIDYHGNFSVGYYEPDSIRDARADMLIEELRRQRVDVVALQEVNPACGYSHRMAAALGFDEIHQVCNAGVKLLGTGIPVHLNEGISVLAHPRLKLRLRDIFKIDGSFGIYGDWLTLQLDEANFALVGKILLEGIPVYVVNLHLRASLPRSMKDTVEAWRRQEKITDEQYEMLVREVEEECRYRENTFFEFLDRLEDRYSHLPVILLGDFNAEPSSPEITALRERWGFRDVFESRDRQGNTWTVENGNAAYSTADTFANGEKKETFDLLVSEYDRIAKRIDYVFVGSIFERGDITDAGIILEKPKGNLFASDHFGVAAEISFDRISDSLSRETPDFTPVSHSSIEGFPILTYDTDVGLGYGGKGFFLNTLGQSESFDVTIFNSVKIERWYRLVFSIPDFELRQRKVYPLSFDLIIDYDKYLKANLYPVGNFSPNRRKEYTREPLEIGLIASRGFYRTLAAQCGIRYKTVNNSELSGSTVDTSLSRALRFGRTSTLSLMMNVRFDSRDSYINPREGIVLAGEIEGASRELISDFSFVRSTLTAQYFTVLMYPLTVFAGRCIVQAIAGSGIPLWARSTLGGNNTLRGSPLDRFIDNDMALLNAEIRFPIVSRLGGILFYDAGRLWNRFNEFRFSGFHANPGLGLRFIMDTFVVRLDIGMGKETTGLYFNFGHAF